MRGLGIRQYTAPNRYEYANRVVYESILNEQVPIYTLLTNLTFGNSLYIAIWNGVFNPGNGTVQTRIITDYKESRACKH